MTVVDMCRTVLKTAFKTRLVDTCQEHLLD